MKMRPEDIFLQSWRPYAWIALVGILLYYKTLFFNFSYLDDQVLIVNNYKFLIDISSMIKAFTQKVFKDSFLPYYRPVLIASFIMDAQLGGVSPFIYHLTNVAIHIVAATLVFVFFTKLQYRRDAALFFGMLFAVHPVLTQAVAWIPGRNDSLLAVFILASFISFVSLLKNKKTAYYIMHELFFLLALFTKESALILIAMCILYVALISKERASLVLSRRVWLGWLAVVGSWVIMRLLALQGTGEVTIFDVGGLLFLYFPAIFQFIGKIFLPFNLSVFPILEGSKLIYGYISISLIFALLLITKKRRYNFILFGFAWLFLFLAPSLIRANFRISADFLEHRAYLAMVGAMIIVLESAGVRRFDIKKPAASGAAILIICAFFIMTFRYSDNFRDKFSFWENAVKNSPKSAVAHQALGILYHVDGALDKAQVEYLKSLSIYPLQPEVMENLGNIYFRKNLLKKAEAQFKKALALYTNNSNVYVELGVLYYREGNSKKAEDYWKRAIAIYPFNVAANKDLAIYYFEKGEMKKSIYFTRRLQQIGVRPPEKFLKSLGID